MDTCLEVFCLFLIFSTGSISSERNPTFSCETTINNVAINPETEDVYVGAVNALFQLYPNLVEKKMRKTGPEPDNRQCTPPITKNCEAVDTDNINKLLLINKAGKELIVCGSLFRGLCTLLNLDDIDTEKYYKNTEGEKTFVVSCEEKVSVVGVVSTIHADNRNLSVFFVGKGYGSQDTAKLVSTRLLMKVDSRDIFESYADASTLQANSFLPKYKHSFTFSFQNDIFAYFLFSRTNGRNDNSNYTFVSRLCQSDKHYYSYMELQLNCSLADKTQTLNTPRSAYVTEAGEHLAKILMQKEEVAPQDQLLFVLFSSDDTVVQNPSSALCIYPLKAINERLESIQSSCYSDGGIKDEKQAAFTPYLFDQSASWPSKCQNKQAKNIMKQYRCGDDFLPTPVGTTPEFALSSKAVISYSESLTAVAVAVENGHSVAFLGNDQGSIYKVHLAAEGRQYEKLNVGKTRVNKQLLFDKSQDNLYVTMEKKITRIPVQNCERWTDCQSCIKQQDPYCGWCVLEGKCTRRAACPLAAENNHWLWSPDQKCIEINSFEPSNQSRGNPKQVTLTLNPFPLIEETVTCDFGGKLTEITNANILVCEPPSAQDIPSTPQEKDFVEVKVKISLTKSNILLASGMFQFYDCSAAMRKQQNMPCFSCVTSQWHCQWNLEHHRCEESTESPDYKAIGHNQESQCPLFEDPSPSILSVGIEKSISFTGRNLDFYQDKLLKVSATLMNSDVEVIKKDESYVFQGPRFSYDQGQSTSLLFFVMESNNVIDSNLSVTLYNCSFGRNDCSLCKNTNFQYNCVWCKSSISCLHKELCEQEETECPQPEILDMIPRRGPLEGGISVTIKGSNMGITKNDISKIQVAGIDCMHKEDKYAVSTSVVCETGASAEPAEGNVLLVLTNGKSGLSKFNFSYKDPQPNDIQPTKGQKAGGTNVIINGVDLDVGTKDDVLVEISGTKCTVVEFGAQIICKTGGFPGDLREADKEVKVKYGKFTEKKGLHFEYVDNPTITKIEPDSSFGSGGRNVTVTGTGFDVIQNAIMRVKSSSSKADYTNVSEHKGGIMNESTMYFLTPKVGHTVEDNMLTYIVLDDREMGVNFKYHDDPVFNVDTGHIFKKAAVISVAGKNLNLAMTEKEAIAFVGDEQCTIKALLSQELLCEPPATQPRAKRVRRDTHENMPDFEVVFGFRSWILGKVNYENPGRDMPLHIILPVVIIPMLAIIAISVYCYRRKSRQAEREYERVRHQLESLEESVRDRCKKEFTDLMIEMEDQTNDLNEAGIPFLDYKTYTDRVFFLPSKDGENDVMVTGKLDIPEARRHTVEQALNQFSNLLNSKPFLISFIHTLEGQRDFNARVKVYFASLLTVALHGKLEYYTDIMRTLLLELMEQYVAKNPKLMLRRSETVVERMLCNWMSICLYQFLKDSAGEPLYKLFKAIKHQVEKGPVDAALKKAKYTLNDTGLLGDDVEYSVLTLQVLVQGEGPDVVPVKVLSCDTISQVKEKVIEQAFRNVPYSQRPKADSVLLEWRPGSTGQILSDLDLTSQKDGRWKRMNTLAHYNVRDNATLVLSKVLHLQQPEEHHQDPMDERNALLEDNKVWHLVRSADEVEEVKSKGGSMKEKAKAITEIYLTRLLSVKGTLQQFVDNFFRSVLCSSAVVPPAVKYFFDFLDEQGEKHENVDEETIHIWKTNSLPLRFWVNILKNPHFIFDIHVHEVVDASLSVIAQTFMDACTKSDHKLSRDSPSNKLLYAKEISTYKKMVDDYYKGIKQMVSVSDQDMNTYLAEISRAHTDKLNTQVALHQLYQYASKYYDEIINALDEDPATQNKQLTLRLQQIAAALEHKVTDL
ncbi:plexin-B2 [Erpetoichthys calabaricus]|uniref:plexin-B2 n=1 Tax=Erpetoichthys calabaricus TaxID=27687 RepID=UPI002234554D|nr:plexin-B2 [Erpetoichthys calabaricus]